MRALLQRVLKGEVRVDGKVVSEIDEGFVIFLGIRNGDTEANARELAGRCSNIRLFPDDKGKMNRSLSETGRSALVVSQFTLYADTRKGNRPGFSDASPPEIAEGLYTIFVSHLQSILGPGKVATGIFKAMMDVTLVNNGPVTILLEDKISTSSQVRQGGNANDE